MESISALWGFAIIALRIAIPIYLYSKARETGLPQPVLWILFGLVEPVGALMLYYLIKWIRPNMNR